MVISANSPHREAPTLRNRSRTQLTRTWSHGCSSPTATDSGSPTATTLPTACATSLSIIRAGGNDSAPGQPVTGAWLATRVALLNAAELYDPRVRVSRAREERRKDYCVLSLLLDTGRATGADGDVMAWLQVLPSELVREVIEWF